MTPSFWLKAVLLLLPVSALAYDDHERYCERKWYGMAPLCDGRCPTGWSEVIHSVSAPGFYGREKTWCGDPVPGLTVHCENRYGSKCVFGGKALCEHCSDMNERI
ncbi:MAG: hypothetical protein OHK93_008395 [Ramalina farinacea]|uniref:Uncharacterized protein n=1 Tax=Ramalina farinacea TaxID=258253 RepID=A0AA43QMC6_9LECA|nr:hypothetical protein [Ramalina farinacea]